MGYGNLGIRRIYRLARRFGYARLLCLILLPALVGLRVWDPPLIEELRVRVFDTYQLIRPREITQRPVVIVDIDEKSLAKLGTMAVAAHPRRRSGATV